ncbi:TetR/AcrR family transcriptional regulator [Pseudomonas sp. NY15435]|uniref:TetR/AcrR family transcriptional regulator n=1 Tax=Pseudomonas sp. NY15435 TaxID=3400358 RepID=UPI003A8BC1A2
MGNHLANAALRPEPSRVGVDRHAEVLRKALELFSQRGFAQVSMRELGASLGIRAGSLYHHIDSKDALLHELLEDLYCELLALAANVQRRIAEPSLRLHALVEAHLELHSCMAGQFQLAEHDVAYLSDNHRSAILALRQRYEAHYLMWLDHIGHPLDNRELRSVVRGLVSILNQLPLKLLTPQSTTKARTVLLRNMALGALYGAVGTRKNS